MTPNIYTNIVWTTFVLIKIQDCAKNIEKQKKQTLQKLNGIITINIHFKPIVKFMLHILPQDQPHGQLPKTDIMKDTMTDQLCDARVSLHNSQSLQKAD